MRGRPGRRGSWGGGPACDPPSGGSRVSARTTKEQGTAVTKNDQKRTARTNTLTEPPVMPDVMTVAMSEISGDAGEGLLAIAVGARRLCTATRNSAPGSDPMRIAGLTRRADVDDPSRSARARICACC